MTIATRRRLALVAGLVYGVALLAVVFLPVRQGPVWDLLSGRWGIAWSAERERLLDVLANVVLFVPAGAILFLWFADGTTAAGRAAARAIGAAATLAVLVETGQWLTGWRIGSLLDALADTAGGALGAGLARALTPRTPWDQMP